MWSIVARILARPAIVNWIIKKYAQDERVYYHIVNPDNPSDQYMCRWWILKRRPWMNFCIRLHWIKRADLDVNMHSHPFNYRTFILLGAYVEERPDPAIIEFFDEDSDYSAYHESMRDKFIRSPGETIKNSYGSFHRIGWVHPAGVWTVFVMWGGEKDDWGFMTQNGYMHKDAYFASKYAEQR